MRLVRGAHDALAGSHQRRAREGGVWICHARFEPGPCDPRAAAELEHPAGAKDVGLVEVVGQANRGGQPVGGHGNRLAKQAAGGAVRVDEVGLLGPHRSGAGVAIDAADTAVAQRITDGIEAPSPDMASLRSPTPPPQPVAVGSTMFCSGAQPDVPRAKTLDTRPPAVVVWLRRVHGNAVAGVRNLRFDPE